MIGYSNNELSRVVESQPVLEFWEGNIKIPRTIITQVAPLKERDIGKERNDHLKQRCYGELSFGEYLSKIKGPLTVIEQYPVIIDSPDLWKGDPNKKMLYLDFFLPAGKTALEIDYPGTHDEDADYARDLYLAERFGIRVERFCFYKSSERRTLGANRRAEVICKAIMKSPSGSRVDYSNLILRDLETRYRPELLVLDALRKKYEDLSSVSKRNYHDISKRVMGNIHVDWRNVAKVAGFARLPFKVI